jgi:hypothetical protein
VEAAFINCYHSVRCGLWFQCVKGLIDVENNSVLKPPSLKNDPTTLRDHQKKKRCMFDIQDEEDVELYKRVRIRQERYGQFYEPSNSINS